MSTPIHNGLLANQESLSSDLRRPIPVDRVAHAFGNLYYRPMRSARVGNTRVIVDGEEIRAYDLLEDPAELAPRTIRTTELEALIGAAPAVTDTSESNELDLETRALRALGYVQ